MRTRKFQLLCIAVTISLCINAQLKVNANGSISTGYTGYPNISLGNTSYDGYVYGNWAIEVWGDNLNLWRPWPNSGNVNGEGNYYIFLTPAGGVGIGKAPTQYGVCLDVDGIVYSSGLEITSDERLKSEIKPLTDKLNQLYQLNGKSYKKRAVEDELTLSDIKDDKGNIIKKYEKSKQKKSQQISEFGFLAQELIKVYPELVSQDTLGYYSVNYIGLIPVLVEALKEQKAEIEALKLNFSSSLPKKAVAIKSTDETDALTYPVLDQNVPNPFNVSTTIGFFLPSTVGTASIYAYDMNGSQLKSYSITTRGKGNVTIQGSAFSAGMYLYALIADGKVIDTKRMILTK